MSKDNPEGLEKDLQKFGVEYAKVKQAWKRNLTERGGLHLWVDIWGEAAKASSYATAKIVAVLIPLSALGGGALGAAVTYLVTKP